MKAFAGKRILLLQGPMGPFFSRLARDLRHAGAKVYKVNFNGGDWLFSPSGSISFRGRPEEWPDFLERLLIERRIDMVFLFGDCRPIHRPVREIVHRLGVTMGVFEEGYIRPDYITLEEDGVNGYSSIPSSPDFYLKARRFQDRPTLPVGNTIWHMALWDMMYYAASALGKPLFRHYKHHRSLSLLEALPWINSLWRKCFYTFKERTVQARLSTALSMQYFLVPLQVLTDGQIHVHSSFGSVAEFIRYTLESFAKNAPSETHLVLKHHPFDRGYNDYSVLIRKLTGGLGLDGRVTYVHDLHLPTLLHHARGVIVINSTVGLSAIHHGTPVKTCGRAIYDMEGLTYQGGIDDFWKAAPTAVPDKELYIRFRNYIIKNSQLNGNYYKRLKNSRLRTGIDWRNLSICPNDKIGREEFAPHVIRRQSE